jgi:hypothetical protein
VAGRLVHAFFDGSTDAIPIYVNLDNLSAHTGAVIRNWARRNKVELCFTPTNAS